MHCWKFKSYTAVFFINCVVQELLPAVFTSATACSPSTVCSAPGLLEEPQWKWSWAAVYCWGRPETCILEGSDSWTVNQQKRKPATRSRAWLELLQLSLAGSRKIIFNCTEEVSVALSALSKAFIAKAARLSIMRYDGMTQERFLHVHQPMMNVCVWKSSVSLFQTGVTLMMPLSLWLWGLSGMHA